MDHLPEAQRNTDILSVAAGSNTSFHEVSVVLTSSSTPYASLRPLPNITLPARKRPLRRPSTASSAEERLGGMLLPSCPSPSSSDLCGTTVAQAPDAEEAIESTREAEPVKPDIYDDARILEMNRRAHAAVEGLQEEASRLAYSGEQHLSYVPNATAEAFSGYVAIALRSLTSRRYALWHPVRIRTR